MKTFCLKIKKYALIGLFSITATPGILCMITVAPTASTVLAPADTGSAQVSVTEPIAMARVDAAASGANSNPELIYTHELTEKITFLFDGAVKLLLDFVDNKNTESYGTHVNKFAAKIKELQENIIDSIDIQLNTATGTFKNALVVAKDLVQDMLTNITQVHTVLVKHLPNKNAINLKADLEPVVKQITSAATFGRFDSKLVQLHAALVNASHTETAAKIAEVRTELKKAKAEYDAQKVSAKMLGVLRRRLRRK